MKRITTLGFLITLLVFALFSCSTDRSKDIFLDYELGMSKEGFEFISDSLLSEKILYRNKRFPHHYMYDFRFELGQDMSVELKPTFDNDVLSRLELKSVCWDESRRKEEMLCGCRIYHIKQVLNLYKRKFGTPKTGTHSYGSPYTWRGGIKEIVFDISCGGELLKCPDTTLCHSYSISYSYTESERNRLYDQKREDEATQLNDL